MVPEPVLVPKTEPATPTQEEGGSGELLLTPLSSPATDLRLRIGLPPEDDGLNNNVEDDGGAMYAQGSNLDGEEPRENGGASSGYEKRQVLMGENDMAEGYFT